MIDLIILKDEENIILTNGTMYALEYRAIKNYNYIFWNLISNL